MTDSKNTTPPAFLTPPDRVPGVLRELLKEADGCHSGGFLTGGTACVDRALQALLACEKVDGSSHQARVRALAEKHPSVPQLFIKLLLQSGDGGGREGAPLSAGRLGLLILTLKAVAYEIYVVGHERAERLQYMLRLMEADRGASPAPAAPPPGATLAWPSPTSRRSAGARQTE